MAGDFEEEAERPLDPATERLRRKMIRLLAVSIGVMLVSVMAVLAAVVYKIAGGDPSSAVPAAVALDLPADAAIEDMALGGDGEALLRVREGASERILRIDLATGRVTGAIDIRRP